MYGNTQKILRSPEAETKSGTGGVQRETESSRETELREKIAAVRFGHTSGGYCNTELLKSYEKDLAKILEQKLAKAKPSERASIERQLAGFAWKPRLVVAPE